MNVVTLIKKLHFAAILLSRYNVLMLININSLYIKNFLSAS